MPSGILQSVLLNKNKFTLKEAKEFMAKHSIPVKKLDETEHFFRFRQVSPQVLFNKGYSKIRTKVIIPNYVEFIFAYK